VTEFLGFATSGILVGALYSIVALGVVLIFKTTQVFNLAQGEMLLIGTWLGWAAIAWWHLPIWLAFIVALVLSAVVGMVIERFVMRPMVGQPLMAMIMITIGILSVLRGISLYFWGGPTQAFPRMFPAEGLQIGALSVSLQHLYAAGIAVILVVLTYAYFRYTRGGLAMRAMAEDHQVAQSVGLSVTRGFSRAWMLSAIVATAGGILLGSTVGVDFSLSDIGLKAFPVVMLGGFESIPGVLLAGPIMGLCEFLGAGYVDPLVGGGIGEIMPFVVMLIVLLFRPYGLFGYKTIERV